MTKELFITATPNSYGNMMWLMEEGHKAVERQECKDFICQVNWKENCVKLYLVK